MPFPYFENISTELTGTWSSPRKRKAPSNEQRVRTDHPPKRKASTVPCPHSMTIVRSTRQLAAEKQQCPICLEDYFSTPDGYDKVSPVKMGCSHVFCRECIEIHLSSSRSKCPLPWCEAGLPIQPDLCELCAVWEKDHATAGSLVVTVRASEMVGSIKDAMCMLVEEDKFYNLPKQTHQRLFTHVRTTLKRYEWQFHSGVDLAELLDPFLLAVNAEDARKYYGPQLSAPAPESATFPPREHDPEDYRPGEEPWVAAFFRQWAQDYEKENGEVREGWGVWAKKVDDESDWEWPYKRILTHKTGTNGTVEYLVKWVGQRYFASWVRKEGLNAEAREIYDKAHGVVHD